MARTPFKTIKYRFEWMEGETEHWFGEPYIDNQAAPENENLIT